MNHFQNTTNKFYLAIIFYPEGFIPLNQHDFKIRDINCFSIYPAKFYRNPVQFHFMTILCDINTKISFFCLHEIIFMTQSFGGEENKVIKKIACNQIKIVFDHRKKVTL